MENFMLAFGAVFPMFVYMALGKLISVFKFMAYEDFRKLNQVIFEFFIPCMLFSSIYESDFRHGADPTLIAEVVVLLLVIFALLWLIVPRFIKDKANASVMIQAWYRSNFVLFGMLLGNNIYPDRDLGIIAAMAAFVVPLYNIIAVVLFEAFRGGKVPFSEIVKKICQNKLVIAGVLGVLFSVTGIRLPVLFTDAIADIGDAALLMALVCIGGMISLGSVMHDWRLLTAALAGRLLVVPLIAVPLFVMLGCRDVELVAILAAFASPCAVAGVSMAYAMGGNGDLAGEIQALSSVCSLFTILIFIWVLRSLGLIM